MLPLNQVTVLAVRAAGWQQGQVDVCPWVGKWEKHEMGNHTFIVHISHPHRWDWTLGGVGWECSLHAGVGLAANKPWGAEGEKKALS